jgi:hypothetical protein
MTDWETPESACPRGPVLAVILVLSTALASCGAGVAGVVASAGGASGGSDAWKPASAPEVLPGEDLPREIRDLPLTLGVPGVMGTPSRSRPRISTETETRTSYRPTSAATT